MYFARLNGLTVQTATLKNPNTPHAISRQLLLLVNKDSDIFQNFLVEMGERLQDLEDGLEELEKSYQPDLINKLFRAVHTIKGGGGFLDLAV